MGHLNCRPGSLNLPDDNNPLDWNDRNFSSYETIIQDTSTSEGTETSPNRAVDGGKNVTESTIIDGFTINGGYGDYNSAIFTDFSSLTITNNSINLGREGVSTGIYIKNNSSSNIQYNVISGGLQAINISASSSATITNNTISSWGYAIYIRTSSSVTITNNTISSWRGIDSSNASVTITNNTISSESDGIYISSSSSANLTNNTISSGGDAIYIRTSSSVTITNNTISSERDGIDLATYASGTITNNTISGESSGIYFSNYASGTIINNTISGGSNGVHITSSSSANLTNNIIFTSGGDSGYCIKENVSSTFSFIQNNNLFDCPTAIYYDYDNSCTFNGDGDGDSKTCMLFEMEALSVNYSGNISEDPQFVNPSNGDWHLTGASPINTRQGGLNGASEGWNFSDDLDGISRTNDTSGSPTNANAGGWSIGAYEFD